MIRGMRYAQSEHASLPPCYKILAAPLRAGIAVDKQHLIWKSVELEDKLKIADYKLTSGTTIQLVTAMRGGPLNIRRGE